MYLGLRVQPGLSVDRVYLVYLVCLVCLVIWLGGFKFQVQRVNEGAIAHRLPGASQSRDIFVGVC